MLNATGVGHRYSNKFDWLFRDLDVTIPPGEVVCVLGPTPRGKTTLLTCLAGIRTPREGRIEVTGSLGFVPQSHATDHPFAVLDMVLRDVPPKFAPGQFSMPRTTPLHGPP